MPIQIHNVELQPFGTLKLNVNQRIILEYHGIVKVDKWITKVTLFKKDDKEVWALQTTDDKLILKRAGKHCPKAYN